MATPQDYCQRIIVFSEQIQNLLEGIKQPTSAETAPVLARLSALEQELRMMRREIVLDEKQVNSDYRELAVVAANKSPGLLGWFESRKAAGQRRADAKRNVARECEAIVRGYDQAKLLMDKLLNELAQAKLIVRDLGKELNQQK